MPDKQIVATTLSIHNLPNLQDLIAETEEAGIDRWHIDVCHRPFTPTQTDDLNCLDAFRKYATKPVEVHIMSHAGDIVALGAEQVGFKIITPHIESSGLGPSTILGARQRGISPGLALTLETEVSALLQFGLQHLDRALLLSGGVGITAQGFNNSVLRKITELVTYRTDRNPSLRIGVDGGIYPETAALCARTGADDFCCGSFLFHGSQGAQEKAGGTIAERVGQIRDAITL